MENLVNMELQHIYNGKKVFVTGHTGFKGSWLISWLHLLGAEIKGYALAPSNENDLYYCINGDSICTSVIADIRNKEKVKNEILDFNPDFIFHLAAQPLVIESYINPVYTHEVNAIGTANVLDALIYMDKPCIAVMITTDKVYHNYETGQAYKEDDRLGGYDPYSASKAAAEIIIDSYRKSFFNPSQYSKHSKSISVGRAGNVIGGGDWADNRIIPDIIKALSNNKPVEVRNPNAVRPWQHVLEPISGYLTLAAKQMEDPIKYADAFNFGPYLADNITVQVLVEKAIECWGIGTALAVQQSKAPHEAGLLQLDITKAIKELNWKPILNSSIAIEQTITWYHTVLQKTMSPQEITFQQISSFLNQQQ